MPYGVANIFKACYRLGRKAGNDDEYDLNKIIYFAQRELEYVKSRREAEAAAKAKAQHYGEGIAPGNLPRYDPALKEKIRRILEVR
jgi:DNA invertase Pin-like site-specific DNA recombinase